MGLIQITLLQIILTFLICPSKNSSKAGMIDQSCNPNTQETEAGRSHIWGQPGLSQKKKRKEKKIQVMIATNNHWHSILWQVPEVIDQLLDYNTRSKV
jgi:hypothetical protein